MRVYTEDASALLRDAMKKYNQEKKIAETIQCNDDYFGDLAMEINNYLVAARYLKDRIIRAEILYKHYYINLHNHHQPEIGYSNAYLNAISQYTYNKDYIEIYRTIIEDAEEIPEFPPHSPSFPATPLHKLNIEGFTNVWLKDESYNPTGTHKDRLAWEVYLFYDEYIRNHVLDNEKGRIHIPRLSLISSGNSAIAIQTLLKQKGLPNLKVILNSRMEKEKPVLFNFVKKSGCEVYPYDLEERKLTSRDIKIITENYDGIDLTWSHELYERKLSFYDWLTYEVLNQNPHYVFVPYGSGDLYSNLVEINTKEIKRQKNSKRYFGNKNILSGCHFYGAAVNDINTKFCMLYAPYNKRDLDKLNEEIRSEKCAPDSRVIIIPKEKEEQLIAEAATILYNHKISAEESGMAGVALFLHMREQINDKHAKIIIVNTGKLKMESPGVSSGSTLNYHGK
jgi:threonine synthase